MTSLALSVDRAAPGALTSALTWVGWFLRPWEDAETEPLAWMLAQEGRPRPARAMGEAESASGLPREVVLPVFGPVRLEARRWLDEEDRRWWLEPVAGDPPIAFVSLRGAEGAHVTLELQVAQALLQHPAVAPTLRAWLVLARQIAGVSGLHVAPERSLPAPDPRAALSALNDRAFAVAAFCACGGVLSPADRAEARWMVGLLRSLGPALPDRAATLSEALLDASFAASGGDTSMRSLRVGRLLRR